VRCRSIVLLLLPLAVACTARADPKDECHERVAHMRATLGTNWDRNEPPSDVADWVAPVYREFRQSRDPHERAAILDKAVPRTIDGCYGLADAFHQAANTPAGARRAAMTRLVPDALESCRCRGVDVESLGFLLRLSPAG
jgi:hypothetical protein